LARLDESIAAFNQRFIFPLPFAMKIIKINLWNQGRFLLAPLTKNPGYASGPPYIFYHFVVRLDDQTDVTSSIYND
jgi:hypothetical protein